MLEISKYIKELLFIHDCVILPGFGGFLANYKPAKVDDNLNVIFPPTKAIGFNRNLLQNDGLLITRLAEAENLSYAEAEKSVQFFIEDIRVRIQRGEKLILDQIGCFFNDKRHNLQFEPSTDVNFLAESFGLDQFELPMFVKRTNVKSLESASQTKVKNLFSNKRLWYAAAAIPFVLTIALLPMNSEKNAYQNQALLGLLDSEKVLTEAPAKLKAEISPIEELVRYEPKVSNEIVKVSPVKTGRFYLIAGSFTSVENAEILKQELIAKSYPAQIIENKNLFSVAINQFEKRDEADQFKKTVIARNPKAFCWVLQK